MLANRAHKDASHIFRKITKNYPFLHDYEQIKEIKIINFAV